MADDLLDHSPLLEISQSLAGQATVDLETVDKGGDSDETVGLDILVELLSGRLLKDDGVLGLVLNYTAKPMSASFCAMVSFIARSFSSCIAQNSKIRNKIYFHHSG